MRVIIQRMWLPFWKVFNSEQKFVSTDNDNQEFYWKDFDYIVEGEIAEDYEIHRFTLVDLDQDGVNEIVLVGAMPESTQVLRYEYGVIYSLRQGW